MNNPGIQERAGTAIQKVLDLSALAGEWTNTNSSATGIIRVLLTPSGDRMSVRIFGSGSPEPFAWGEAPAEVFADNPELAQATSFTSFYNLGFMSVWLQTYVVKGVLVLVSFTQFHDGSERSNYFGKEFFFRSRE